MLHPSTPHLPDSHDHPLPGDFIVRRVAAATDQHDVRFAVLAAGRAHPCGEPYRTLAAAIRQANRFAARLGGGLQVWVESRTAPSGYRNVTLPVGIVGIRASLRRSTLPAKPATE